MSIVKKQVDSSPRFVYLLIAMTDNSPVDFKSSFFKFGLIEESHQNPSFEWSQKHLPFIRHVIFQTTGQLEVMLDKSVNNVLGEGGLSLER